MKIKKGDTILLITGKDRGKKGKVLQVIPTKDKVVVDNINLKKKHVRPKKSGEKGQVVEFSAPVDISNVKLVCPKCSKPSRVGYIIVDGKKDRVCKKCEKKI
ncbi:MAG: 50S ribosomal protein L24 [Candidatus Nealsonbacteria bacterium]|nr:50S ribosomal protein L24 [Candidatus Nealsonbacteria bacterium]